MFAWRQRIFAASFATSAINNIINDRELKYSAISYYDAAWYHPGRASIAYESNASEVSVVVQPAGGPPAKSWTR
jgi:hypothetical protein